MDIELGRDKRTCNFLTCIQGNEDSFFKIRGLNGSVIWQVGCHRFGGTQRYSDTLKMEAINSRLHGSITQWTMCVILVQTPFGKLAFGIFKMLRIIIILRVTLELPVLSRIGRMQWRIYRRDNLSQIVLKNPLSWKTVSHDSRSKFFLHYSFYWKKEESNWPDN